MFKPLFEKLSVERDFIVNSDTGKTMDMIKAVGHLGRRNVALILSI